jgi:hypothetical protein
MDIVLGEFMVDGHVGLRRGQGSVGHDDGHDAPFTRGEGSAGRGGFFSL